MLQPKTFGTSVVQLLGLIAGLIAVKLSRLKLKL